MLRNPIRYLCTMYVFGGCSNSFLLDRDNTFRQWQNYLLRLRRCKQKFFKSAWYSAVPYNLCTVKDGSFESLNIKQDFDVIKALFAEIPGTIRKLESRKNYKNLHILLGNYEFSHDNILMELADIFSINGDLKELSVVIKLYEKWNTDHFTSISCMSHFIAQATWNVGNFKGAFDLFLHVYDTNGTLRLSVERMIKFLIVHVIEKEGRAVNMLLSNFISNLHKKYDNVTLFGTLWYALLLSDCFGNKKTLSSMLLQSCKLKAYIESIIPRICADLLHYNRIVSFYLLMEVMLKCSMEQSFGIMLRNLFDYYYRMGNRQQCYYVVQCSQELGIRLTNDQEFKFSILLKTTKEKDLRNGFNIQTGTKSFQFLF